MNQYCVIVANAAKTKFFTLEKAEFPEIESSPNLIETNLVTHPDHQTAWKLKKPRVEELGGCNPEVSDCSQHIAQEQDQQYMTNIAKTVSRLSRENNISELVLVSQKQLLGDIRLAMKNKLQGVKTLEVAKDLSKLSPLELHNYLAREKLIPTRRKPNH